MWERSHVPDLRDQVYDLKRFKHESNDSNENRAWSAKEKDCIHFYLMVVVIAITKRSPQGFNKCLHSAIYTASERN